MAPDLKPLASLIFEKEIKFLDYRALIIIEIPKNWSNRRRRRPPWSIAKML